MWTQVNACRSSVDTSTRYMQLRLTARLSLPVVWTPLCACGTHLPGTRTEIGFSLLWPLTRGLRPQTLHCNAAWPYCTCVLPTVNAAHPCDGRGRRAGASVRVTRLARADADRGTRFVSYIAAV